MMSLFMLWMDCQIWICEKSTCEFNLLSVIVILHNYTWGLFSPERETVAAIFYSSHWGRIKYSPVYMLCVVFHIITTCVWACRFKNIGVTSLKVFPWSVYRHAIFFPSGLRRWWERIFFYRLRIWFGIDHPNGIYYKLVTSFLFIYFYSLLSFAAFWWNCVFSTVLRAASVKP